VSDISLDSKLIAGVDEAGRGCVIGPLAVAGVMMKESNLHLLKELGVKDSKLLTPQRREALFGEIVHLAEKYIVFKLAPSEIDRVVESQRKLHKLNRLEAQTMAKIIEDLKPDMVYVDAADVLEARFRSHIQDELSIKTIIVSEHKADRTYPIVSAASIIAKVERDRSIALLSKEHGDFGSGYLTDPKTMVFLKKWLKVNGDYPDFVRKSWKPAKKAKDESKTQQTKLA
jgi:ribonuclease HII